MALIALGGVFWNTYRNDKGRKEEMGAADQRHRASIKAAEPQERDDQEQERLEQLQREDWTRQRHAVAECIRKITKAAAMVNERAAGVHLQDNGTTEQAKLVKAVELSHFYVEATNQMMLLDIEITQPHVSAQLEVLWNQSSRPRQPR